MKIHAPFVPVRQTQPSPSRGTAAGTFADLIRNDRGGGRAISERALGFGESGILGIHYALMVSDDGRLEPLRNRALGHQAEQLVNETSIPGNSENPAVTELLIPSGHPDAGLVEVWQRPGTTAAATGAIVAAGDRSARLLQLSLGQLDLPAGLHLRLSDAIELSAQSGAPKSATIRTDSLRPGPGLRLILAEGADGISVLLPDLLLNTLELEDYSVLARILGGQFGVTVKRVFARLKQ